MIKRYFWLPVILLLIALVATSSEAAPAPAAAGQGKTGLVLAHYYAWFDPSSFGAGKTPFTNPNPYFSSEAATMQRHVDLARSAGIDGFVQAWYGPDSSQQTEPNFATLLNIAGGSGFKAAVTFEPISGWMPNNDARAAALQTLLSSHAQHPAYLRMDGKPVIFFWANWALSVADWEYIRSIADPNRSSIWIAEGGNMPYLSVFDGMYLYNIAWSPDPGGINIRWAGETRAASATYGGYKYWVATAMPGFNDSLLGRGNNSIVRNRADGAYLQASFSGAAASGPDLLVITSFNEWPEGSHIEPSSEFGDFYLNLTRDLVNTFKSGGIPVSVPVAPAPPPENEESAVAAQVPGENVVVQQQGPTNTPFPTATPAPTSTPRPDGAFVHVVAPGDTLISIAITYDVDLQTLYDLNNLGPNSLLSVGRTIILGYDQKVVSATATAAALAAPPTSTPSVLEGYPNTIVRDSDGAIVYSVKEGNTLIEIALIYGLTLDEIYGFNGLNENSLISVGQSIVVGYVPTPEASEIGGSADLPQGQPTATATASPTPPPPTEPPPTAIPSPTIAPTAQPTAAATLSAPQTSGTATGLSNMFLIGLFVLVAGLALIGLLLVYLGRRR